MLESPVHKLLREYSQEGYLYMNEDQPENMQMIEDWLRNQQIFLDFTLYRRTDYEPYLSLKEGDIILLDRVTSWSVSEEIPDEIYEDITSVKFILLANNRNITGANMEEYSFWGSDEEEIILPPTIIKVDKRIDDILYISLL